MKRPPVMGAGRDDVGSVPASVAAQGQGMRPHVREQLRKLARFAVQNAEGENLTGGALALLSDLAALGIRPGSVAA